MTWIENPLFGVAITVITYAAALSLQRRWHGLHPLFVTAGGILLILLVFNIPYATYQIGGDLLAFFLGPATVALAVPIYKHFQQIRDQWAAIAAGIGIGSLTGLVTAASMVALFGGGRELMMSAAPKSVTAPISIEISRALGGLPELTAVLTVLTGLLGSMFGPRVLRACGIRDDIALGVAMGTSSHGIGTARMIRESELQGTISGFAMGVAGIMLSLMVIPLHFWL